MFFPKQVPNLYLSLFQPGRKQRSSEGNANACGPATRLERFKLRAKTCEMLVGSPAQSNNTPLDMSEHEIESATLGQA